MNRQTREPSKFIKQHTSDVPAEVYHVSRPDVFGAKWWDAYERYLQSPIWLERRRRVLQRAQCVCEGCGNRRASEVHHRLYPQGTLPGSPEWIAAEKLFDLAAVCPECHADLHPHLGASNA